MSHASPPISRPFAGTFNPTSPENTVNDMDNHQENPVAEKLSIQPLIDLTSTIIFLSYSIKIFTARWQLIRYKLDELLSGLNTIGNRDSGDNTSLSGEVIQAITSTLSECNEFARKCIDLTFSGKLLMQSDLAILFSKLDTHAKCLFEIYTLKLLNQNYAIVVKKPGTLASRDDMKFYMNDLYSRLKIGDNNIKLQALIAFNELILDDDKYVKIGVETDGLISILVNFLGSVEKMGIQEEAARGVCLISGFEAYRGVLVEEGLIAPLIGVLENGSGVGRELAATCLMNITENSDNAWSVSAHGGVPVLLMICRNGGGDSCGALVGLACGVLKNIVGVEEIKKFMVEEGVIEVFVKLARSKDEVVQINSIEFLQTIAFGDESVRNLVSKEGGISMLVRLLDPKSTLSSKVREVTFRAIMNLCGESSSSLNILMNSDFINYILYFLRNGEVSVQELALKAAFWLCGTSDEAKRAMGDSGFMPEFVKFLDAKSVDVREMAAETLSSLVLVPRNRKKFMQNEQNVDLVLQLLDSGEVAKSGERKLLLSILMQLINSTSGRKKIANSGYLKNIEKLADAEVSDAKKIVRRLSSNRFKNMFNGLWHS